jgi:biopolymer transport protein ExbB/TolQ
VAPHTFSIYDLILNADIVVKSVMLALVVSSVACWAIIFEKLIRISLLNRDVRKLEAAARGAASSEPTSGVAGALLKAAHQEAEEGAERGESRSDLRARLDRAMRSALKTELQRIEAGLPFLATVGSAAPFVGLFGTVWGIMNSFTAIGQQQDTSLATVAPGIAEALFATALGLAAAIPAVMAYNHFAVKLGRAAARAGASIAEIARKFSKHHGDAHPKATVEPLRAGKSF